MIRFLLPWSVFAFVAVVCACGGDRPGHDTVVAGSLAGKVHVTGPVRGAIVSAHALDLATGEAGPLIGRSEPTDEFGTFAIEMGIHTGPVLLEARGPAASY